MGVILGKYFEDFKEGMEFLTLGRTMTEADIVNFSGFTGDFNPLHTDAQYASESMFGERIAHGMCGLSMATGLLVRLNIFEGTIVAFYGIDQLRFRAPIKIGDTIHVVAKVIEKKESKKEGEGLVAFQVNVVNQHGAPVMEGVVKTLMKKRPT
ncbi:MAG TPA: MaoC/PaaZ C-terminal domain-containing protein [Thermodesulfobacteriota bacterium]|jgi:acyl dehydratase|nr:MaoC/PaaZ C-terminal domain-containing protein [Thermodesulfobacteriota bacterium]